jgi:hypothetical protein
MRSLDFTIYIILPAALWSRVRLQEKKEGIKENKDKKDR